MFPSFSLGLPSPQKAAVASWKRIKWAVFPHLVGVHPEPETFMADIRQTNPPVLDPCEIFFKPGKSSQKLHLIHCFRFRKVATDLKPESRDET